MFFDARSGLVIHFVSTGILTALMLAGEETENKWLCFAKLVPEAFRLPASINYIASPAARITTPERKLDPEND